MAAQRFVTYWKCRREVFGPDKFAEPMTLSGAFRDDLKALQTGVCRLLPKPDASGRPIIVTTPSLNTRGGYDSDSLVSFSGYCTSLLYIAILSLTCGLLFMDRYGLIGMSKKFWLGRTRIVSLDMLASCGELILRSGTTIRHGTDCQSMSLHTQFWGLPIIFVVCPES